MNASPSANWDDDVHRHDDHPRMAYVLQPPARAVAVRHGLRIDAEAS